MGAAGLGEAGEKEPEEMIGRQDDRAERQPAKESRHGSIKKLLQPSVAHQFQFDYLCHDDSSNTSTMNIKFPWVHVC